MCQLRRFTVSIASLVAIAALLGVAPPAAKADAFDDLRNKWVTALTGGPTLDTADPDVQARLIAITEDAQTLSDSMQTTSVLALWPWMQPAPDGSAVANGFDALSRMALAYAAPGSGLYQDPALRDRILFGMSWMFFYRYNASVAGPPFPGGDLDWVFWAPQALGNVIALMYADIPATTREQWLTVVDHFVTTFGNSQGYNLMQLVKASILRGMNGKNAVKIEDAVDQISETLVVVTSGNGVYPDGSHIFHSDLAQNGAYGGGMLAVLSEMVSLLYGSQWAVTDPNLNNLYQWVYTAYEPFIYNGAVMESVIGRNIAVQEGQNYWIGRHEIIRSILQLAEGAPEWHAKAYRQMVKRWMQNDIHDNALFGTFFDTWELNSLRLAKLVANDASIVPAGRLIAHRTYNSMDRVVHHGEANGSAYAFGLAMYSKRIQNYESINDTNVKGWHTGDGMTYLYNADHSQYADAIWPTIDWKRMPGTTVDSRARADADGQVTGRDIVGGTDILGKYGIASLELFGIQDNDVENLRALKSWFMFDDEIVCLGSNISNAKPRPIETIVENRKLNAAGDNVLSVNGVEKPSTLGWSEQMTGVTRIHLAGSVSGSDVGYYFPGGATIKGLRSARSGRWSDIRYSNPPSAWLIRKFMTLWFDHGTNFTGGRYSYAILPNRTAAQVDSYASKPDYSVLVNDANIHAVKENKLNVVGAKFWRNTGARQTVDLISAYDQASVMTKENAGRDLEVSISDPSRLLSGWHQFEFSRVATSTIFMDQPMEIVQLSPTIIVRVNFTAARGRKFRARFQLGTLSQPFNDTFNGNATGLPPTGWTVNSAANTSATVQSIPSASNKSFRFVDNSTTGYSIASHSFTRQTGTVTFEFKFMQPTLSKWMTMGLRSGDWDAVTFAVAPSGASTMGYLDSWQNTVTLQSLSLNTWYTVKLVASVPDETAYVYINGAQVAAGIPFRFPKLGGIDNVAIATSKIGAGASYTTYVDDVKVTC